MAKSWKKFIQKPSELEQKGLTSEKLSPDASLLAFATKDKSLQKLLKERELLESNIKNIINSNENTEQDKRYLNEVPNFQEKKKQEREWLKSKEKAREKAKEKEAEIDREKRKLKIKTGKPSLFKAEHKKGVLRKQGKRTVDRGFREKEPRINVKEKINLFFDRKKKKESPERKKIKELFTVRKQVKKQDDFETGKRKVSKTTEENRKRSGLEIKKLITGEKTGNLISSKKKDNISSSKQSTKKEKTSIQENRRTKKIQKPDEPIFDTKRKREKIDYDKKETINKELHKKEHSFLSDSINKKKNAEEKEKPAKSDDFFKEKNNKIVSEKEEEIKREKRKEKYDEKEFSPKERFSEDNFENKKKTISEKEKLTKPVEIFEKRENKKANEKTEEEKREKKKYDRLEQLQENRRMDRKRDQAEEQRRERKREQKNDKYND